MAAAFPRCASPFIEAPRLRTMRPDVVGAPGASLAQQTRVAGQLDAPRPEPADGWRGAGGRDASRAAMGVVGRTDGVEPVDVRLAPHQLVGAEVDGPWLGVVLLHD